jgi:hypothetical protein
MAMMLTVIQNGEFLTHHEVADDEPLKIVNDWLTSIDVETVVNFEVTKTPNGTSIVEWMDDEQWLTTAIIS